MAFLSDELKDYLHITHTDDDDNLSRLVKEGHAFIQSRTGDFEIEGDDIDWDGKALVFEYVRFAVNGVREHFHDSYMREISQLSFKLYKPGDDDAQET